MRTERKEVILFLSFFRVYLSLLVFFPIIESCESLGGKLNRKGREAKTSALLFFWVFFLLFCFPSPVCPLTGITDKLPVRYTRSYLYMHPSKYSYVHLSFVPSPKFLLTAVIKAWEHKYHLTIYYAFRLILCFLLAPLLFCLVNGSLNEALFWIDSGDCTLCHSLN